jgi:hypothetical protein
MSQPHHPLVEAALLLDRSIRLFLTNDEGLHAETWILAVARRAGTELQRSILSGGTRDDEGAGGRRFWSLRPRPAQACGDEQGQRLVAVLLATLAQLGEPLAEEAIICPPEGSAGALLSLEQTRERLGTLVAACARSYGLAAVEMAEALTIATALAMHQCRELVPLTRGAGLAVTGLVEGAKTARQMAAAA